MIPNQFQITTAPLAEVEAIVKTKDARFTILTSRMIRMEYDQNGDFEDRASQIFWFRRQPVPAYTVRPYQNGIEIITEHLHLFYSGGNFGNKSLFIRLLNLPDVEWHYDDEDQANLGGTARTLDGICGQTQLEPGLISRSGWTVIDDTRGLMFNPEGWLESRKSEVDNRDIYFLGYGHDYQACLREFCLVSGPVPLIPRWILGNWWSRYWAYSQQELISLMHEFQAHQIPLGVCITDMDWHLEGWTGYTWNRILFPDPPGYMKYLHNLGLHTALNLHPALGIWAHEEKYPEMARAMGIAPETKQAVRFEIENPDFVNAYFEILHHPMEAEGVDFWWMDWQQGNPFTLPGLNLLWWINHLHFYDLSRENIKRPFVFSRWGGLGNHRYPIGFSGDTVVTWESLAFQPYFTATAANVGYGWWSHDIGGHMEGIEDAELFARWVQFGVFSPIFRLHSTKNPYHERRPWKYDAEIYRVSREAMQLRHALIPYLYSMSWRNHTEGIPPIVPMYYHAPEIEDAYACPNQYLFGSEMIAAPFVTPHDPETGLSRQVVWLPVGDWYDFSNGHHYTGGGWQAVYGGLDLIPLFAKAGAIVPLSPKPAWGGLEIPHEIIIHVFPGKNNLFELYEDDGISNEYKQDHFALTTFRLEWGESTQSFIIEPVKGSVELLPEIRSYTIVFHAVQEPYSTQALVNNESIQAEVIYSQEDHTLEIRGLMFGSKDQLILRLETRAFQNDSRVEIVSELLRNFKLKTDIKHSIDLQMTEIISSTELLENYLAYLSKSQIQALFEVITGCGVEHISNAGEELLVMWNRYQDDQFRYAIAQDNLMNPFAATRFSLEKGTVSSSRIYRPAVDFTVPTQITIHYGDLFTTHLFF